MLIRMMQFAFFVIPHNLEGTLKYYQKTQEELLDSIQAVCYDHSVDLNHHNIHLILKRIDFGCSFQKIHLVYLYYALRLRIGLFAPKLLLERCNRLPYNYMVALQTMVQHYYTFWREQLSYIQRYKYYPKSMYQDVCDQFRKHYFAHLLTSNSSQNCIYAFNFAFYLLECSLDCRTKSNNKTVINYIIGYMRKFPNEITYNVVLKNPRLLVFEGIPLKHRFDIIIRMLKKQFRYNSLISVFSNTNFRPMLCKLILYMKKRREHFISFFMYTIINMHYDMSLPEVSNKEVCAFILNVVNNKYLAQILFLHFRVKHKILFKILREILIERRKSIKTWYKRLPKKLRAKIKEKINDTGTIYHPVLKVLKENVGIGF